MFKFQGRAKMARKGDPVFTYSIIWIKIIQKPIRNCISIMLNYIQIKNPYNDLKEELPGLEKETQSPKIEFPLWYSKL